MSMEEVKITIEEARSALTAAPTAEVVTQFRKLPIDGIAEDLGKLVGRLAQTGTKADTTQTNTVQIKNAFDASAQKMLEATGNSWDNGVADLAALVTQGQGQVEVMATHTHPLLNEALEKAGVHLRIAAAAIEQARVMRAALEEDAQFIQNTATIAMNAMDAYVRSR